MFCIYNGRLLVSQKYCLTSGCSIQCLLSGSETQFSLPSYCLNELFQKVYGISGSQKMFCYTKVYTYPFTVIDFSGLLISTGVSVLLVSAPLFIYYFLIFDLSRIVS